jgi:hypothetical protein
MDVKRTFLHSDLYKEIYMCKPLGCVQDPSLVCRLWCRPLYGLKKSSRAWYENMESFLIILSFHHFQYDPTVYTKKKGIDFLILVLYVDDVFLMGSSSSMIQIFQQN